jgi:hypothetical protein
MHILETKIGALTLKKAIQIHMDQDITEEIPDLHHKKIP